MEGVTVHKALRNYFLFSSLNDEQVSRITSKARKISVSAHSSLFEQGDIADRFFLLLNGKIKLYRLSPDGNEKIIEFVNPGQSFAEAIMLMDRNTYPVSAMALSDSELISIDSREFSRLLKESVDTCFLLMADMSKRIRGLIKEIDDLSLHSATCRVSAYLLQSQMERQEAGSFKFNVPKSMLASRLSVKPETFSRILKSLVDSGVISVAGDCVTVHDEDKLREFAQITVYSESISVMPNACDFRIVN
ncbi:MAG: Crp/Fnr family transcriptional regulator [Candidatus Sedimenticola sp. PURPLELP]